MRLLRSHSLGSLAILAGILTPPVSGQITPPASGPTPTSITATGSATGSAISWGNGLYGELTFGGYTAASAKAVFTRRMQSFEYTTRSDVSVTKAALLGGTTTIATAIPTPTSANTALEFQDTAILGLGKISLNSTVILDSDLKKVLYLQLNWTDLANGEFGYSSQAIIYVNDAVAASDVEEALSLIQPHAFPTATTYTSTPAGAASPTSTRSTTTAKAATTTLSTTTTDALASPGTSQTTTSSPDDATPTVTDAASPSKKSGLAGGAIAGIVIGVLALLAIAGAAFFFYRRQRARAGGRLPSAAPTYRGSGSEQIGLQSGFPSAAVLEKDGYVGSRFGSASNAGAHSPYTDDEGAVGAGSTGRAGSVGGAVPTVAVTAPEAHYPKPAAAVPVAAGAGAAAGAAAKPAVKDHVAAALIEEHMTSDDVARLAAEERELDEAIETSQRNRTARQ